MATTIYLDNAATTKTTPEVVKEMIPYFTENYGNPSAIYEIAGRSKEAIEEGRKKIAHVIGAEPEEIYFTAGGSESDNWALKAALMDQLTTGTTAGTRAPGSVWTCLGSSNGTTAALDNVDRIETALTGPQSAIVLVDDLEVAGAVSPQATTSVAAAAAPKI